MSLTRDLALFVLVLALLRAVFLLSVLDPAEERVMSILDPAGLEWKRGPDRPLYDREELYAATAGEAIRQGAGLPLAAYRFMSYGGGSLAVALATVPLYALAGPHYLTFKLVALFVTLAAGGLAFAAARRIYGRTSAWVFGLLFCFAPPLFVRTMLIAKGDHAEAAAWVAGVLLTALLAGQAQSEVRRRVLAATAGALWGLAIAFSYSTAPAPAGALVVAAIRSRLRPRGAWIAGALGLAVGLVPWAVRLAGTGGRALEVYDRSALAPRGGAEAVERLRRLVDTGLLASYEVPGGLPLEAAAGFLWMIAVGIGWVGLARGGRRIGGSRGSGVLSTAVLGGTAAHLAAFVLIAPEAASRYLVPVYPLLLFAAADPLMRPLAASPETGASSRRFPVRRAVAPALVLALGVAVQGLTVGSGRFLPLRAHLAGTDWPMLGEVLGQKLTTEALRDLPADLGAFAWFGYGKRVFWAVPSERWPDAAAAAGEQSRQVWRGIGLAWAESARLHEAGEFLRASEPTVRRAVLEGIGINAEVEIAAYLAAGGREPIRRLLASFDPADRPVVERALARVLATFATQQSGPEGLDTARLAREFLSPATAAYGAGWGLFRGAGVDGPEFWRAPEDAWTAPVRASIAASAGAGHEWAGAAEAYGWELRRRSPRWLIGIAGRPDGVIGEVSGLTRRLPDTAAEAFWVEAGRAVGEALGRAATPGILDPDLPRSQRSPGSTGSLGTDNGGENRSELPTGDGGAAASTWRLWLGPGARWESEVPMRFRDPFAVGIRRGFESEAPRGASPSAADASRDPGSHHQNGSVATGFDLTEVTGAGYTSGRGLR